MKSQQVFPRIAILSVLIMALSLGTIMVQKPLSTTSHAAVQIDYQSGITYYSGNGYSLKLDLCKPITTTSVVPGVILIHGGGWTGGTRDRLTKLCQSLARVGYVAATVDYRLAPAYRYPAQLDDVQYAVRWMRSKAAVYGIDPNKIISWGESAGGNLASMLGILDTRSTTMGLSQYPSKTQAVVNEYGPQDLTRAEYQSNPLMKSLIEKYIGYTLAQRPDLYRAASPYFQANSSSSSFLMISGSEDIDVPAADLNEMRQKLNLLGVTTDSRVFPGAHNFIEKLETLPTGDASGPVRQVEFSYVRNRMAGNLCLETAKTMAQTIWIDNQAYSRTVPINPTTKQPDWAKASKPWIGPISPVGLIDGSGPVYTDDIFVYPSAKKLIQAFWRPTGGYAREVPIKSDGTPDWSLVGTSWPNPISASEFPPFTGDMQASDSLIIGKGSTLLQSYWRNNQGYVRYSAVDWSGNPAWEFAGKWSGPLNLSGMPGTVSKPITAQTSFIYPDGRTMLQAFWRVDEGFVRTVALDSGGYPDWNRIITNWTPSKLSDLPVTKLPLTVTGMSMYYSDCN